jgi:peptidoglycan biosynthesis protein MviN/MurJ (putative lipid II flippase)
MGQLLSLGAFSSPVVAILCALLFYGLHWRAYPNPERRVSFITYVLALLVCAIIAYLIGMEYGLRWACFPPSAGNLCFLTALFVVGPFAAALAIFFVSASIMLLPGDEKGAV